MTVCRFRGEIRELIEVGGSVRDQEEDQGWRGWDKTMADRSCVLGRRTKGSRRHHDARESVLCVESAVTR